MSPSSRTTISAATFTGPTSPAPRRERGPGDLRHRGRRRQRRLQPPTPPRVRQGVAPAALRSEAGRALERLTAESRAGGRLQLGERGRVVELGGDDGEGVERTGEVAH